jgi:hypothetical protein
VAKHSQTLEMLRATMPHRMAAVDAVTDLRHWASREGMRLLYDTEPDLATASREEVAAGLIMGAVMLRHAARDLERLALRL